MKLTEIHIQVCRNFRQGSKTVSKDLISAQTTDPLPLKIQKDNAAADTDSTVRSELHGKQ